MAVEMTLPMAIWMAYRGYHRRGVLEMSAAAIVPAIVFVLAAEVGLIGAAGIAPIYHIAMPSAMIGLMLFRRAEYSGGMSPASANQPTPTPAVLGPNDASDRAP